MNRILAILLISLTVANANVISYHTAPENDPELNDCVEKAIESLMDSTCLFFRQSLPEEATVTFLESSHCAWQSDNRTVHLNADCITDDLCFELVGRSLSVDKPRSHMVRHINLHYNCTEKCTIGCENGGEIEELDCSCKCGYGFTGESCEELSKSSSFTDDSCGVVEAESTGHISLSTYPSMRPKTTFCQWLIKSEDPWTVIDAEIQDLGLDNIDVNPGTRCNDLLTVYGTEDIKAPIPCDNSANVTQLHSTNNWLLIELRTNPWSEHSFKGPSIKYSTRKVQPGIRIFSEGMSTSSAAVPVLSGLALLVRFI